jgi:hypothetical protein
MNKYSKGFLSENLKNCRARTTCDGGFEGDVKVVRVIFPKTGHDWGYFAYSDEAIRKDIEFGFTVLFEGDEGFEPEEE